MSRILLPIISILLLVYPLAVFFGLQYLEPRYIGFLLLLLLAVRIFVARQTLSWTAVKPLLPATGAGLVCCLLVLVFNSPEMVKLNPLVINVVMLAMFALSLVKGPPVIERLARIQEPNLPEEGVEYTRKVTVVWCGFFIINGLLAAYTTFYTSIEVWTLYNGLLSYLMMAMVFGVEYCVRQLKLKKVQI